MKSKEQEKFEREWHERRAAERAAWGAWSAYQRQVNLDRKLDACKTKEERKKMLDEARSQNKNGFYVG